MQSEHFEDFSKEVKESFILKPQTPTQRSTSQKSGKKIISEPLCEMQALH